MPVATDLPPAQGDIVRVRSRRYLVEEVTLPVESGDDHLVRLSCLEDDAEGEELLREFADQYRRAWPGQRRPEVYYDPRGLSTDPATRATWHAKCVVVDDELSFVTSANFTEWAHQRNAEAGVLIRSRQFNAQLRQQFDSLVRANLVLRLPGA